MVESNADLGDMPRDAPMRVLLSPEIDRIFDSLCHHHRRLILLLLKHKTVTNQNDLLFRNEEDSQTAERELVHNHLPKLEEAGYIEWDRDTGEISEGPRFDEIEPLLKLISNHADELPPDWP